MGGCEDAVGRGLGGSQSCWSHAVRHTRSHTGTVPVDRGPGEILLPALKLQPDLQDERGGGGGGVFPVIPGGALRREGAEFSSEPAQLTPAGGTAVAGASGEPPATPGPLCPARRPKSGPVTPPGACCDHPHSPCLSPGSAHPVLPLRLRVSDTSPSRGGFRPPVCGPCGGVQCRRVRGSCARGPARSEAGPAFPSGLGKNAGLAPAPPDPPRPSRRQG